MVQSFMGLSSPHEALDYYYKTNGRHTECFEFRQEKALQKWHWKRILASGIPNREVSIMEESSRFIRVRKANRSQDRGIIAVDAICAAFENQEAHKTEVMTIDGFWYEVVDSIEEVYAKLVQCEYDVALLPKTDKENEVVTMPSNSHTKTEKTKRRKITTAAVAEDKTPKNHECERMTRSEEYAYPKKGYGQKRGDKVASGKKDLPSSEGEGHHESNPRSEYIPPQIES